MNSKVYPVPMTTSFRATLVRSLSRTGSYEEPHGVGVAGIAASFVYLPPPGVERRVGTRTLVRCRNICGALRSVDGRVGRAPVGNAVATVLVRTSRIHCGAVSYYFKSPLAAVLVGVEWRLRPEVARLVTMVFGCEIRPAQVKTGIPALYIILDSEIADVAHV